MAFEIKKAVRSGVKVKIALMGGAGSGKTLSALKIARGLVGPTGKILLFDSENRRAESYADQIDFDTAPLTAPYRPELYIEAINAAVAGGYDCAVLDSITPEWDGKGGILEEKEILDRRGGGGNGQGRGGNGFANWAVLTPRHQSFVEAIVQAPIHLICTVRAKQEYAMGIGSTGRNTVEKLGVKPIQREGIEYEFHLALLLDQSHQPVLPPVKDTTGLFESFTGVIDTRDGEAIGRWANSGTPFVATPAPSASPAAQSPSVPATNVPIRTARDAAQDFGKAALSAGITAVLDNEGKRSAKMDARLLCILTGVTSGEQTADFWDWARTDVLPAFVFFATDPAVHDKPIFNDSGKMDTTRVKAYAAGLIPRSVEGDWNGMDWEQALSAMRKGAKPATPAPSAPPALMQRTTPEPSPTKQDEVIESIDDLADPFAE